MVLQRVVTVVLWCAVVSTAVVVREGSKVQDSTETTLSRQQKCRAAANRRLDEPGESLPTCGVRVGGTDSKESCEKAENTFRKNITGCLREWKSLYDKSDIREMGYISCSMDLAQTFRVCVRSLFCASGCSQQRFNSFYQKKNGPRLLYKNINTFCCKPFQKKHKNTKSERQEHNAEPEVGGSERNRTQIDKLYDDEDVRFGNYYPTDRAEVTTTSSATTTTIPSTTESADLPVISTEDVVGANSAFALDLYRQISRQTDGNVFFSPYSISAALAMTHLGARGTTAEQMSDVLHLADLGEGNFHQAFSNLSRDVFNYDEKLKYTLLQANKLYGQSGMRLTADFLEGTSRYYNAPLETLDFGDEESSRGTINSWVSAQTKRKINDLIPEGVLTALTRLVLVNAVYFKGTWQAQFNPDDTYERKFFVSSENHPAVPTMHQRGKFRMAEMPDLRCRVLKLPYTGNEMAMFVILPSEMYELNDVEAVLTTDALLDMSSDERLQEVRGLTVALPKFRLTEALSLKDQLTALGMTDLFSMETADLSGVTGEKDLHVSAVLHKAFVEVNEEGSEAAAASAVVMRGRSGSFGRHFVVNRPFLFFIQHKPTNTILFMGRVVNPNQ